MMTKKRRSQRQEKSVAKSLGAKLTPASGAKWGAKGDVRSDKFLVECKTTTKDTYRITTKVWEKIRLEATKDHGRIPLLVIDLCDHDRYVVFRPKDFEHEVNSYECHMNQSKGCNSIAFSGCGEDNLPLLFSLKADKIPIEFHILMVMEYSDFKKEFEVELCH